MACHQTELYGVIAGHEDNRNGRGQGHGRSTYWRPPTGGNDYCHLLVDEIGGQSRETSILPARPPILDRDVLSLDIASITQALTESCHILRECLRRATVEEPDHRPAACRNIDFSLSRETSIGASTSTPIQAQSYMGRFKRKAQLNMPDP